MGLFNLISRLRQRERLAKLARRIAERSLDEVARRVVGMNPEMPAAELRGYIRARAAVVVYREVNVVLAQERRLRFADRTKLIRLATEDVVNVLVAQTSLCRARLRPTVAA